MTVKNVQLSPVRNYHYVIVGFAEFKEVLKKIKKALQYYRFQPLPKKRIVETYYDNEYKMLSDAGIVLSKSVTKKDTYFNIRRLSRVLDRKTLKNRIETKCLPDDHPRNYSVEIADAIAKMFSSSLTIDIENIVKKTSPIIDVGINKAPYELICGTGYRAKLTYEEVYYRDIATGKKIFQECVCLTTPDEDCAETQEILKAIERHAPAFIMYQESRFEFAQKLLYAQADNLVDDQPMED